MEQVKMLEDVKEKIAKQKGFTSWHNAFIYGSRSEIVSILNESALKLASLEAAKTKVIAKN